MKTTTRFRYTTRTSLRYVPHNRDTVHSSTSRRYYKIRSHQTSISADEAFPLLQSVHPSTATAFKAYGFRTVRQGESAAIWKPSGKVTFVNGPKRLFLFGSSFQPLEQVTSDPSQFIEIKYRDGKMEYKYGAATVTANPLEHQVINLRQSISVNSNEAMVVYREYNGNVERKVVKGPTLHMPSGNEWIHHFIWHGADPNYPDKKKIGALQFTKLRLIPYQMYYDVEQVRTSDDALLTVKLMLFYQLVDINKMLDQTNDPIADFINGATADVIDFTAARSFEKFKAETEYLNDLKSYPHLMERAASIGYKVDAVVFRGYLASSTLQNMHNNAIEKRTQLVLEQETEQQAQKLADFKLAKEKERMEQQLNMNQIQVVHAAKMDRIKHEEQLKQQEESRAAELEHEKRKLQQQLEHAQQLNEHYVSYFSKLKAMGVDLTAYLVAREQGAPNNWIKVDSSANVPLHLHTKPTATKSGSAIDQHSPFA